MLLEVKKAGIKFGGLQAVSDVDIEVENNQLVGLIGPNGAGKTTIFNLLTGVYTADSGSICINNTDITKKKTYEIVRLGLARTFQNIRLFKHLTVLENIKMAYQYKVKYSNLDAIFRNREYRKRENEATRKAIELLDIFDMKDLAEFKAESLSYGQQRKLEIARALATKPKLLLLDEPAAGMNPQETLELMNIIKLIKEKFNISILL
ncbi:ABC transporter ATP-binding protein, partial [Sneathia sp. DSM 16630]|nr:ABC transporter ATP-binding protein [Sneathia sp. DSM 16630]